MAKTPKTVDHLGKVVEITLNDVKVCITSSSACSGCHAKGVCGMSDSSEKIIVVNKPNHNYIIDQTVKVILKQSLGFKALLLGYLLPFIVVITTLIILNILNFPELQTGLYSLLVLVPYYLILYLFKDKISRSFNFEIESIS